LLNRRQFAFAAAFQAPPRPNVLFLLCQGWGRQDPPSALLPDAVTFTRAYASNPDSAPSQAALHTGRYSHATGVTGSGRVLDPDQRCFAQNFADAGYRTVYAGRWDLDGDSNPRPRGFSHSDDKAAPFLHFAYLGGTNAAMHASAERLMESVPANTIVIVTGDHGRAEEEGRGPFHEEQAGVPLAIRWPGKLAAGKQDWLFNNVDVAPTLLGLCGLPPLEAAQGEDRSALILHQGVGERPESIYAQGELGTAREWRMVVRGWDKLVVDRGLNVTHLYNLAQDPLEKDNLAIDRATIRRQEELGALLRRWILKAGDRVPYPVRTRAEEKKNERKD